MMFSFEKLVHVDMTEFEHRFNEVFNDYRIAFRFIERRAVALDAERSFKSCPRYKEEWP